MTLKKFATTAAVTLGLLASHTAMFASAAQARDHHGWRTHGQHRPYAAYGHGRHHPQPYHHGHRRDRTGDAVGAAILGIGALIVGAAIADAARKKRYSHDQYDD